MEPLTIRDYMLALGASLEVGLRSRRRILLEVYDHLCQAATERLRGGDRGGGAAPSDHGVWLARRGGGAL